MKVCCGKRAPERLCQCEILGIPGLVVRKELSWLGCCLVSLKRKLLEERAEKTLSQLVSWVLL